jgi:hypothetical protein
MSITDFTDATSNCPYCKKEPHPLPFKSGDNEGVSGTLSNNMLGGNATVKIKLHKLYAGTDSLDAHHIIVEKSMRGEPWATYVNLCGYDINHKNNGVFLTSRKDVACKLATPLHTTSHSSGKNDGQTYSALMIEKVKNIGMKIQSGQFCDNFDGIKEELDSLSETTLVQISNFTYELSNGGRNYMRGGPGCGCGDRNNHEISGTEFSPENFVRTQLGIHDKAQKRDVMEIVKKYFYEEYDPKVNDPLKIGE